MGGINVCKTNAVTDGCIGSGRKVATLPFTGKYALSCPAGCRQAFSLGEKMKSYGIGLGLASRAQLDVTWRHFGPLKRRPLRVGENSRDVALQYRDSQ